MQINQTKINLYYTPRGISYFRMTLDGYRLVIYPPNCEKNTVIAYCINESYKNSTSFEMADFMF